MNESDGFSRKDAFEKTANYAHCVFSGTPENVLCQSIIATLQRAIAERKAAKQWFVPKEENAHHAIMRIISELNTYLQFNDKTLKAVNYKNYIKRAMKIFDELVSQKPNNQDYPLIKCLQRELYPLQLLWWNYCETYRNKYLREKRRAGLQYIKNQLTLEVYDGIITSLDRLEINASEIDLDNNEHLRMLTNITQMLIKIDDECVSAFYAATEGERYTEDLPERTLFASLRNCLIAMCSNRLRCSVAKDYALLMQDDMPISSFAPLPNDNGQTLVKLSIEKNTILTSDASIDEKLCHPDEAEVIKNLLLIKTELDTLVQAIDQILYNANYKDYQSRIIDLLNRLSNYKIKRTINKQEYDETVPFPLAQEIKSWSQMIERFWGEYCEHRAYQYMEDFWRLTLHEQQRNFADRLSALLDIYRSAFCKPSNTSLEHADEMDMQQFKMALRLINKILALRTDDISLPLALPISSAAAAAAAGLPNALSAPAVARYQETYAKKLQKEKPEEYEKYQLELCISKNRHAIICKLIETYKQVLPEQPDHGFFGNYFLALAIKGVVHALLKPENLRKPMKDCIKLLDPVLTNAPMLHVNCFLIHTNHEDEDSNPTYYLSEKQRFFILSELLVNSMFLPENLMLAEHLKTEAQKFVQAPHSSHQSVKPSLSR